MAKQWGWAVLLGVCAVCVLVYVAIESSGVATSSASAVGLGTGVDQHIAFKDPVDATIQVLSWSPRVFLYRNFLSEAECDYIVAAHGQDLVRSKVAATESDKTHEVRTSYGAFLKSDYDPILQRIEERVALFSQLPLENQEPFYLLRYQDGQKYEAHHDYFHPELPGMERYIRNAQRMATVLMYLSAPGEGGETYFPNAAGGFLAVKPSKGDAVLFHSMTPEHELDPLSLHGSSPTTDGTKYAMTKWLREAKWG